jgi:spermidine/putrescine-binding protein
MALDLLVSNEVDFGAVTGGPIQKTIDMREPIDFTFNQALVGNDYLVIPRGSKQVEAATWHADLCGKSRLQCTPKSGNFTAKSP